MNYYIFEEREQWTFLLCHYFQKESNQVSFCWKTHILFFVLIFLSQSARNPVEHYMHKNHFCDIMRQCQGGRSDFHQPSSVHTFTSGNKYQIACQVWSCRDTILTTFPGWRNIKLIWCKDFSTASYKTQFVSFNFFSEESVACGMTRSLLTSYNNQSQNLQLLPQVSLRSLIQQVLSSGRGEMTWHVLRCYPKTSAWKQHCSVRFCQFV